MSTATLDTTIDFNQQLRSLDEKAIKATLEKQQLIQKSLQSGNIDDIYKAYNYLKQVEETQGNTNHRAMLIDPMSTQMGMGFLQKNTDMSFDMLRRMSRVHIFKAIISTRVEQVVSFCQPQQDKYSTGFIIRPKKKNRSGGNEEKKVSSLEQKEIDYITNFLMNCGEDANRWYGDDLCDFMRKWLQDSLALDQGTFEVVRDRKDKPVEFLAVDGATCAIADSWTKNGRDKLTREEVDGYFPFFVQTYMNKIVAEFYPWELCFGIRNPQTNIYNNGYGRSELEDLIKVVTAVLNADSYNMNYFTVGSNPKGILKVTGNVNAARIEEFRMQWQAQMAGVRNAHKLPIIEADKMDFISTQQSNKDMEYGKWYEFLIKLGCAVYNIDPSEIGFSMSGSMEQKPVFEGNNEARLKHSRDKGLKPVLRFGERKINKYIVEPISKFLSQPYEMVFAGFDESSAAEDLEADMKKVQNFMTLNELRRKHGLEDIPLGDIVLNPIYAQQVSMQAMNDQNKQSTAYTDQYDEENGEQGADGQQPGKEENPFIKALNNDIGKLLTA